MEKKALPKINGTSPAPAFTGIASDANSNLETAFYWLTMGFGDSEIAAPRLEGGSMVGYIGIAAELKNALKTYMDATGKGTPTLKAEKALEVLLEKLDVLRWLFPWLRLQQVRRDTGGGAGPAAGGSGELNHG